MYLFINVILKMLYLCFYFKFILDYLRCIIYLFILHLFNLQCIM